ncbi:hypothetical protein EV359DRAFT_85425 [Lentinula novae-zelandiae]|nr:hypothetical protein EV359DRAFT_85425 [Lentinula novae-zelandiae]
MEARGMGLTVLPMRNMFIQCWAQMVRHNLTLGFISSHNTSFGIQRGREGGMVTISPLDQAKEPGYILRLSQMVLKAYQDAAERTECHHSDGVPNWQDPYLEDEFSATRGSPNPSDTVHPEEGSGKTCDNSRDLSLQSDDPILLTNETKFGNNDTEDEGNSEKSKGKQKKNPKRKGDDNSGFNYDHRRDGGSGGAGAGGNGASSSSGYKKSYGGSTQLSSGKRSEGSSSQSGSNKRAHNHLAFYIQAKGLHLAFDCPKELLKSDGGFSHFDLATDSNLSVPFPSDHAGKVPLSPPIVDISTRARTSSSVSTSSSSTTESLSTLGTGSSLPTTPSNPTFGISPQSSPNYKVTQIRRSISPSSAKPVFSAKGPKAVESTSQQ